MKDTDHTRIELSPEIHLYKFPDDVTEYKGELSIWACLPDEDDRDDEVKHVNLMIGKVWGHDDRFLELTPEQARETAKALLACANEVEAYEPVDDEVV